MSRAKICCVEESRPAEVPNFGTTRPLSYSVPPPPVPTSLITTNDGLLSHRGRGEGMKTSAERSDFSAPEQHAARRPQSGASADGRLSRTGLEFWSHV